MLLKIEALQQKLGWDKPFIVLEDLTIDWLDFPPAFTEEQIKLAMQELLLEKEELAIILENNRYLTETDYKMTVDYFATLSKEVQEELITKRAQAREAIRKTKQK